MSLAPILCGIERWWRPNRGRERTAEILPMLCEGVRQGAFNSSMSSSFAPSAASARVGPNWAPAHARDRPILRSVTRRDLRVERWSNREVWLPSGGSSSVKKR